MKKWGWIFEGGAVIDWGATGAMLQGIGTILGATAVIVGAAIGGTTFNSWKKQQLLQKHMQLAERVLSAIFKAREQLTAARSPLLHQFEIEAAESELKKVNLDKDLTDAQFNRAKRAQTYLNRINHAQETWIELEECKASSYAYFGTDVPNQIDRILKLVSDYRWNATFLAEDDGNDGQYSRQIRNALSSARTRDGVDTVKVELDAAIKEIEQRVTPFIRDAQSNSQSLIDSLPSSLVDMVVKAVISTTR